MSEKPSHQPYRHEMSSPESEDSAGHPASPPAVPELTDTHLVTRASSAAKSNGSMARALAILISIAGWPFVFLGGVVYKIMGYDDKNALEKAAFDYHWTRLLVQCFTTLLLVAIATLLMRQVFRKQYAEPLDEARQKVQTLTQELTAESSLRKIGEANERKSRQTIARQQVQIDQYVQDLTQANKQLTATQSSLKQANEKIADLEATIRTDGGSIIAYQKKISELEDDVRTANKTIDGYESLVQATAGVLSVPVASPHVKQRPLKVAASDQPGLDAAWASHFQKIDALCEEAIASQTNENAAQMIRLLCSIRQLRGSQNTPLDAEARHQFAAQLAELQRTSRHSSDVTVQLLARQASQLLNLEFDKSYTADPAGVAHLAEQIVQVEGSLMAELLDAAERTGEPIDETIAREIYAFLLSTKSSITPDFRAALLVKFAKSEMQRAVSYPREHPRHQTSLERAKTCADYASAYLKRAMSGDAALAQSYVDSIVIAALADEIGGRLGEASQRISRAAADVSHPSLTSHATRLNARLVRANPNGALQARLQALRPKIDADTSLSGRFARAIVLHLEDKPIDSAKELFSILKTERGDDSPFEFAALQYLAREEIQVALTTTLARSIAHGDVLEATVAQRERTIETMLRNRKNALQEDFNPAFRLTSSAQAQMSQGDWDAALQVLSAAKVLDAGNPVIYYQEAVCHLKQGNSDAAARAREEAVRLEEAVLKLEPIAKVRTPVYDWIVESCRNLKDDVEMKNYVNERRRSIYD